MSVTTYDAIIREVGSRQGVDPALIKAFIHHETGGTFDPRAFRPEPGGLIGSVGLMQILPSTARGVGYANVGDRKALTGLWAPATNIAAGTAHLKLMLVRAAGNVASAASAYNGGWRPEIGFGIPATRALRICLAKDPNGVCTQWRDVKVGEFANKPYVDSVLGLYARYKAEMPPPTPTTPKSSTTGTPTATVKFTPSIAGMVILAALTAFAKLKRKMRAG